MNAVASLLALFPVRSGWNGPDSLDGVQLDLGGPTAKPRGHG